MKCPRVHAHSNHIFFVYSLVVDWTCHNPWGKNMLKILAASSPQRPCMEILKKTCGSSACTKTVWFMKHVRRKLGQRRFTFCEDRNLGKRPGMKILKVTWIRDVCVKAGCWWGNFAVVNALQFCRACEMPWGVQVEEPGLTQNGKHIFNFCFALPAVSS